MTFGFDFFQRQQVAKAVGETYGVSDYFASAKDRYAAFKADQISHDIADYAPDAPQDWAKRTWEEGDVEIFFGSQEPLTAEQLEATNDVFNTPMVKLVQADLDRGFMKNTTVYEAGDTKIALELRFIPARLQTMLGSEQLSMMQDLMRMNVEAHDFARVGGVLFQETSDREDASSRAFTGHIGRQIDIVMRAIGPNTDVLTLMAGIDFDGLNAMVKDPVEGGGNAQEIAFLAVETEQDSATDSDVVSAVTQHIQALLAARAVAQVEAEQAPAAEKPKVRRLGSGNCSGNTFKRCVVKTN